MRKIFNFKVLLIVLSLFIIADTAISIYVYNQTFGKRYATSEKRFKNYQDYENLERDSYTFKSNKDQKLQGYLYFNDKVEKNGALIVFAHGFGGGHSQYIEVINFFTRNGYEVFTYDITGTDESEGDAINGLVQGVIDLDYALKYVESLEEFKSKQKFLFGHSWGGYSVANVLNSYSDVDAVVSIAGFNKNSDIIKSKAQDQIGKISVLTTIPVSLYEKYKFGKYASYTGIDGFKSTTAPVLIIHSTDDDVVPAKYGYDIYYEEFKDDQRFKFVDFTDQGHDYAKTNVYYNGININTHSGLKHLYDNGKETKFNYETLKAVIDFYNNNLEK